MDSIRKLELSFVNKRAPENGPVRDVLNSIRRFPNTDQVCLQERTANRLLKADNARKARIAKEKSDYAYGLKTGLICEAREHTAFIDKWVQAKPDRLQKLKGLVSDEFGKQDDINVLVRIWTRANIELGLDIHQFHPFRVALLDAIIDKLEVRNGKKVLLVMILLCPTSDDILNAILISQILQQEASLEVDATIQNVILLLKAFDQTLGQGNYLWDWNLTDCDCAPRNGHCHYPSTEGGKATATFIWNSFSNYCMSKKVQIVPLAACLPAAIELGFKAPEVHANGINDKIAKEFELNKTYASYVPTGMDTCNVIAHPSLAGTLYHIPRELKETAWAIKRWLESGGRVVAVDFETNLTITAWVNDDFRGFSGEKYSLSRIKTFLKIATGYFINSTLFSDVESHEIIFKEADGIARKTAYGYKDFRSVNNPDHKQSILNEAVNSVDKKEKEETEKKEKAESEKDAKKKNKTKEEEKESTGKQKKQRQELRSMETISSLKLGTHHVLRKELPVEFREALVSNLQALSTECAHSKKVALMVLTYDITRKLAAKENSSIPKLGRELFYRLLRLSTLDPAEIIEHLEAVTTDEEKFLEAERAAAAKALEMKEPFLSAVREQHHVGEIRVAEAMEVEEQSGEIGAERQEPRQSRRKAAAKAREIIKQVTKPPKTCDSLKALPCSVIESYLIWWIKCRPSISVLPLPKWIEGMNAQVRE